MVITNVSLTQSLQEGANDYFLVVLHFLALPSMVQYLLTMPFLELSRVESPYFQNIFYIADDTT